VSAGPGETRFPNSSRDELIRSTDDKVRDAKYRNDAAEIVSAYDRYYATQGAYPWGNGMTLINSTSKEFGVLGQANLMCVPDGLLSN